MFKKVNRNFRRRETSGESDDDAKQSEKSEPFHVEPKKSVANSKLSFNDEEEGDDGFFQLKKSSHRFAKKRKEKKKKEAPKLSMNTDEEASVSIRKRMEMEFASKNQSLANETAVPTSINILNGEDLDGVEGLPRIPPFKKSSMFGGRTTVLEDGQIPDAKLIYELKKKRQMARNLDEWISLNSETKGDDEKEGSDNDSEVDSEDYGLERNRDEPTKSRSIQEDDDDDRMEEDVSDDFDHELDQWEREQIRKGVGQQISGQFFKGKVFPSTEGVQSKMVPTYLLDVRERMSKKEIFKKLDNLMGIMSADLESKSREINKIASERRSAEQSIASLQKQFLDQL